MRPKSNGGDGEVLTEVQSGAFGRFIARFEGVSITDLQSQNRFLAPPPRIVRPFWRRVR
jgi:hypothetical protein